MKKLMMYCMALSMLFLALNAHSDDDRQSTIESRLQETKVRLNLTEEQVDQVFPILENSANERQAILAKYGVDLENPELSEKLGMRQARAMKRELDAVGAETLASIESILTEAQIEEFKQLQEERQAKMREQMRSRR